MICFPDLVRSDRDHKAFVILRTLPKATPLRGQPYLGELTNPNDKNGQPSKLA